MGALHPHGDRCISMKFSKSPSNPNPSEPVLSYRVTCSDADDIMMHFAMLLELKGCT